MAIDLPGFTVPDLAAERARRAVLTRRIRWFVAATGLNTAFGWSWADPIAALLIAAVSVKDGREAWRGDTCCAPAFLTNAGRAQ